MSKVLFSGVQSGVMINQKATCASRKRPVELGYWRPGSSLRLILEISAVKALSLHETKIPVYVSTSSLEVVKIQVLQPLTLRVTLGKRPPSDHVNRSQSVMLTVRLLHFFRVLFQVHVPAGRALPPMTSLS